MSQQINTGTGDIYGRIRLFDLGAGRLVSNVAVGGFGDPRGVSAVVVGSNGSLAWTEDVYTQSLSGFSTFELHEIRSTGTETVVDSGLDLDAASLASSPGHLFWIKGDQVKTSSWD